MSLPALRIDAPVENQPARTRPASHYVVVDGLRGVAAILVLVNHIALYKNIQTLPLIGNALVNHAYLAVDLFFVISGLVMAYAFDDKIANGLRFSTFMKLRVIRLYPMIAVGLALGLITLAGIHFAFPAIPIWKFFVALAMNSLLLPTTALTDFKAYLFPVNSAFWSLSFEMVMYVVYFLTRRFLTGKRLIAFVALLAAAIVVASFSLKDLNVGFYTFTYAWGFARVTFSYFAGVLIKRTLLTKNIGSNLCYLAAPILLVVLVNPIPASGIYDGIAILFFSPLVVFLAVQEGHRLKLNQIAKVLGEISYPLYAIHLPLVLIFTHLTTKLHASGPADIALTLTFTLCLVTTAYYLNRLYDIPVRKALTKLRLGF